VGCLVPKVPNHLGLEVVDVVDLRANGVLASIYFLAPST
jgi:hypothetical protein